MTKAPQRNAWIADRAVEPALPWMVVLSAVLHVAGGVIVAVLPRGIFMHAPAPVVAYTVTIVDPSALGGRLPKGEIRPETPPSGVAAPAPKQEPKPEAKPEPPPEPVEKKPEPPTREESVVTLPDVPKKPEPKPEEKKPPPPKPKPADVKPKLSKAELARLERDKEIQEAVRQLGEKGKGKHASGLGGVEEGKGAAAGSSWASSSSSTRIRSKRSSRKTGRGSARIRT